MALWVRSARWPAVGSRVWFERRPTRLRRGTRRGRRGRAAFSPGNYRAEPHLPANPRFCDGFSALTAFRSAVIVRGGEMTERPKVPDSKSGVPVRVPWVRIPLSPLRPVPRRRHVGSRVREAQDGLRDLTDTHHAMNLRNSSHRSDLHAGVRIPLSPPPAACAAMHRVTRERYEARSSSRSSF
jgi:hypothetical protein